MKYFVIHGAECFLHCFSPANCDVGEEAGWLETDQHVGVTKSTIVQPGKIQSFYNWREKSKSGLNLLNSDINLLHNSTHSGLWSPLNPLTAGPSFRWYQNIPLQCGSYLLHCHDMFCYRRELGYMFWKLGPAGKGVTLGGRKSAVYYWLTTVIAQRSDWKRCRMDLCATTDVGQE